MVLRVNAESTQFTKVFPTHKLLFSFLGVVEAVGSSPVTQTILRDKL